jgi:cellulose synthase/poly-beta-1,6-N-acetylglucosamine synthase-like glycosyltransferase
VLTDMIPNLIALMALLAAIGWGLRRLIFSATMFLVDKPERKPWPRDRPLPQVFLIIPCRNEANVIGRLLESLDHMTYPKSKLSILIVDDQSFDRSAAVVSEWIGRARGATRVRLLEADPQGLLGKTGVLRKSLQHLGEAEIIWVIDADHRPTPNALEAAVAHFADPAVGAVSWRNVVENATHNAVTSYCALEQAIHQEVTVAAKGRLQLAPPLRGVWCARRQLLERAPPESAGADDADFTLSIYERGYTIKYEEGAVTTHLVPNGWGEFFHQRVRWNRGFHQTSRRHFLSTLGAWRLPLSLRIELLLFASGYLDRLLLLVLLGLFLAKPWLHLHAQILWLGLFALILPLCVQGFVAVLRTGLFRPLLVYLPLFPALFFLDLLAAGLAIVLSITKAPFVWRRNPRDIGMG